MMIKDNLTLGRGHAMQYTDDVSLYTWNLYNLINQCHPNKFNSKRKYLKMQKINGDMLYFNIDSNALNTTHISYHL